MRLGYLGFPTRDGRRFKAAFSRFPVPRRVKSRFDSILNVWYIIVTAMTLVTKVDISKHSQIFDAWRRSGDETTQAAQWKRLRSLVRKGELVVVGHDAYIWANEIDQQPYRPALSETAIQVRQEMTDQYGQMNYTLFELKWLNDFLNHLLGRNALFVMVERDYAPFVFEFLKERHDGGVLLDPSTDDFFRYAKDGMMLVVRKPSQGPRNRLMPHVAPPEQWLADILVDARISASFEGAELPQIFSAFVNRYVVNRAALFRYARRRGVDERVRNLLEGDAG